VQALRQPLGFNFGLVSHRSVNSLAQLRPDIAVALLPDSWLVTLLLWVVDEALKYPACVHRPCAYSSRTLRYEIVSHCRAPSGARVAEGVVSGDPREVLGSLEIAGKLLGEVFRKRRKEDGI